jgi:hypothetical protein
MKIGDTKSFKKAVIVFCIVGGIVLVVDFGSYYLGRYGLSLVPFKRDGLWWVLCHDAETSVGPALAVAAGAYFGGRRKRDVSKSNGAAKPHSAANGSQPIRSDTNPTSSAAGSRR